MKINIIFKALSSPIRRDIIARLQHGPMSAGALAELYKVSKPTMSTHFAALKEADLVTAERKGNSIVYSLNTTVTEEALSNIMGLLGTGDEKADKKTAAVTTPKKKGAPS